MTVAMVRFFLVWFGLLDRSLRSRRRLLIENLALRQQLTVLERKHPKPRLGIVDKLFWVLASRFWSDWKKSLLVVTPETVVRWHRAGFRLYWNFISKLRKRVGRKRLSKEVRELIFRN
jgi:putative transposase